MNIAERDRQYVWHPFTQQKNMLPPLPVAKAKGTLLFDVEGHSYIDAISSWWVTLHGHGNEYIARKIYEQALQLEQVIFAGFTHEPAVSLAQRLLELLPGNLSKIFFSDNGSTSTEVALKMALQYWWNKDIKRRKIMAFRNSYHGDTFGAMSVSERGVFTLAFHELLFEVIFIDTPTEENISDTKAIIQKHANEIAGFIYEPLVQGAGGMKMYDANIMNELLNTITQNDIICIADEVMTGFGRTGKFFASEYIHKKPDIICLSKGLTGGTMAMGITACNQKIYDAYITDDALKTFFHGHSFTANPIACAASLASLDLLTEQSTMKQIEWITEQNKKFAKHLSVQKEHLLIKNIRTLGTILAFEISHGDDVYLNNISARFTQNCMAKGVYLRPLGNTVYTMPPYCISEDELQKVFDTIKEVLLA